MNDKFPVNTIKGFTVTEIFEIERDDMEKIEKEAEKQGITPEELIVKMIQQYFDSRKNLEREG